MFKHAYAALALSAVVGTAQAGPVLIEEGFDNVPGLSGWIITNAGTPGGLTQPWVQGDGTVFPAFSGSAESYISSNFNNAPAGGTISSWLITPIFSTSENLSISFWARGDILDGYSDQLTFGLVNAAGDITSLLGGTTVTAVGEWTQYTLLLGAQALDSTARFAIGYVGSADLSNYVGVDNLVVEVPEPGTFALAGISLLGLIGATRRRNRR